jgi:hypothetical protein
MLTQGCTVGVIRIPGGILFFKNRDLESRYHTNHFTVWQSTHEFHALKGTNLESGEIEGVAIGVNRHKVCVANTHVVSTPDVTYDRLCERLVQEVRERDDVPRIVEAFMAQHAVQGGRLLVASPTWSFLVEVYGDLFEIREVEGSLAITNSFSLISQPVERDEAAEQSSVTRLQVASDGIRTISSVRALKGMLRSHLPEKGDLSICNHRPDGGGTESSHIIQIQGDHVGWSHLIGFPCEGDYQIVQLFSA